MRRRFDEMKDLIRKALTDLGELKQDNLVGDIFEIYFNEHVVKMRGTQADIEAVEDDFLFELCELVSKYGDKARVVSLLSNVASTCVSAKFNSHNQRVCSIVGSLHFEKQLFSKAYSYFLRANDLENAIKALKEVMKSGYKNEQDLYVARLCFEVLIRNHKDQTGVKMVQLVVNAFPDQIERPVVTFCRVLCDVFPTKDFEFFKQIVTLYQPQLRRDGLFIEYVDRIAKYYFDDTIKAPNPMQQMLNNMLSGGGGNPLAAMMGGA